MTDLLAAARTLISGAGDRPPESACEYCGDGRTVCVYARDFDALVEAANSRKTAETGIAGGDITETIQATVPENGGE